MFRCPYYLIECFYSVHFFWRLPLLSNYNLEKRGYTYCVFCGKSFRDIKGHSCKIWKCESCFLFEKKTEYSQEVCKKENKLITTPYKCTNCNKVCRSKECFLRHQKLNQYFCKLFKPCAICGLNVKRKHNCLNDNNFCKFCYRNWLLKLYYLHWARFCYVWLSHNTIADTDICLMSRAW